MNAKKEEVTTEDKKKEGDDKTQDIQEKKEEKKEEKKDEPKDEKKDENKNEKKEEKKDEKKDDKKEENKEGKKEEKKDEIKKDMVLYHIFPGRSSRVAWLVYELGLNDRVDIRNTTWKHLKSDEYQKINPNGLIPTLTNSNPHIDLFEAGAIMEYLLRLCPGKLIPNDWSPEQYGDHYKFVFWCITTMDPKLFTANRAINKALHLSRSWWSHTVRPVIFAKLQDKKYLNGDEFTATDVYLGFSLFLAHHGGLLSKAQDKTILDYYGRLCTRPAFVSVFGKTNL